MKAFTTMKTQGNLTKNLLDVMESDLEYEKSQLRALGVELAEQPSLEADLTAEDDSNANISDNTNNMDDDDE